MGPVAGIDGCRGGWLAVVLSGPGSPPRVALAESWPRLALARPAMIAVDMPIGLRAAGPRAATRQKDIPCELRFP